jgi:circadian clock protein KaiB
MIMISVNPLNQPRYEFKLFVTTYATSSQRAVRNLTDLLEEQLKNDYCLEIIDVQKHPLLAEQENITALPLLIRIVPAPQRRLIGDMSDRVKVLAGLNLLPL